MSNIHSQKKNHVKQFTLDVIKVLFLLLILSTLFHSEISKLIDSVSDFAFHHIFFTTFITLLLLAITIEYEFYSDRHWVSIKNFIVKFFNRKNG